MNATDYTDGAQMGEGELVLLLLLILLLIFFIILILLLVLICVERVGRD